MTRKALRMIGSAVLLAVVSGFVCSSVFSPNSWAYEPPEGRPQIEIGSSVDFLNIWEKPSYDDWVVKDIKWPWIKVEENLPERDESKPALYVWVNMNSVATCRFK